MGLNCCPRSIFPPIAHVFPSVHCGTFAWADEFDGIVPRKIVPTSKMLNRAVVFFIFLILFPSGVFLWYLYIVMERVVCGIYTFLIFVFQRRLVFRNAACMAMKITPHTNMPPR